VIGALRRLLWHREIAAFVRADRRHPPQPGTLVFTGSSSIRAWSTLPQDMLPLPVLNRGFGGSVIDDVNHFAQRLILPHQPRAVVLYAGDNDLVLPVCKSPEQVLQDFQRFVDIVHGALPQTWIYYITIKPSLERDWRLSDRTNRMIAQDIARRPGVQLIDVAQAMLDPQGQVRRELYDADPLHMNAAGYALWTSIIKPVLMERFGPQD
jgi:lysophospholipase L1-like esterase